MKWSLFVIACVCSLLTTVAAQPASTVDEAVCVPDCRRGYVCIEGECLSACNPPCDRGYECTDERECVLPQAAVPPGPSQPPTWQPPAPTPQPVQPTIPATAAGAVPNPSLPQLPADGLSKLGAGSTFGMTLRLSVFGNITIAGGGESLEENAATTLAFAPFLDFAINPNLTVGLGAMYVATVKGEDAEDSGSEFDIYPRLTGVLPTSTKTRLFARFSPGYSMIQLPNPAAVENPSGLLLLFELGLDFTVSETLRATTGIGYQKGYQSSSLDGQSFDLNSEFFMMFVGFGHESTTYRAQ
ncbi:MAG: hypothetical protein GY811_21775 [Myxococcales bacterium]|nr:hypothetical protein [Myxococcales bacterium]